MEAPVFNLPGGVRIAPVAQADAASLSSLIRRNADHLREFIPMVAGLAVEEEAAAHLKQAEDAFAAGDMLEWHVFLDGALCGAVRLKDIDAANKSAAVAYFIGKDFQGRGIVTSSVSSVIGYGFGRFGLNRIELQCAAGNLASRRVAERLGFTLEGTLRQSEILHGAAVDVHVFGLLREEFKFQER